MKEVLSKLRWMRGVYRAAKPVPADVKQYKVVAVELGNILKDKLPWVRWPNYLHKVIEHVQ